MIEIRWHGRGGQGVKTAATLLAEVALNEGKYGQGFPEYGPERMGAPMRGFTRLAEEPIHIHCGIANPGTVIVLDNTLLGLSGLDVTEGMPAGGTLVVNINQTPEEIKHLIPRTDLRVFTVDATQIAIDEIGRPIPNTPMIGALVKATGVIKLETVLEDIDRKFGKKFPAKVIEGNKKAIIRAFEEVRG
jgi:pyruvate ferredoxin oxidoreductase gamma subunit